MVYLALDLGSSYIKSALVNPENGEITDRSKLSVDSKACRSNGLIYEISMQAVWNTVLSLIHKYRKVGGPLSGIVLSTQMHGFVYSNSAFGEDIYVSWQDARCLGKVPGEEISYLESMKKHFSYERMLNTGVYLKPALGMCNLYTLLQSNGAVLWKDAEIFTLGSYIIAKLTGNNVCHISNAAPLGLVNIESGIWRDDLIHSCGFEQLRFPTLAIDLESCGDCVLGGERIPVYPDVGDVQCAVLGSGARKEDVVVNMATAGQIIRICDNTDIGPADPNYYEVRPYFDGNFCHVISRMPGGRNLDVIIDLFRETCQRIFGQDLSRDELWNRLLRDFHYSINPGIQVDISFYELPERLSDGSITGIGRSNLTLDHLMSAAFSDIGRIYSQYLKVLNAGHEPAHEIVFCGGAIRNNPYIQDIIKMECGLPGRLSQMEDEVFAGLSQIARWSIERKRI